MDFYMVRHYIYDGYGGHDMDDVIPFLTSVDAVHYLANREDLFDAGYAWETGPEGFQNLVKHGPSRYSYDYYFLEKMTMGKEI